MVLLDILLVLDEIIKVINESPPLQQQLQEELQQAAQEDWGDSPEREALLRVSHLSGIPSK